MKSFYIIVLFSLSITSQNINVNNEFNYLLLRTKHLNGEINTSHSFNIRPLNLNNGFEDLFGNQFISIFNNNKIDIKLMGLDYFVEFNSKVPYNRNNGTMIPNRGYQHIISPGIFIKLGPLEMQFKPEHHFSENKDFNGFWDGHYPVIWATRYRLWNHIDMPEKFGNNKHNKTTLGQSRISLNWKSLSLGLSNENIWWGPSIRNSIMMSNHSEGFKHITLNSNKPIKSFIGDFEFQLISGRLESSGFTPPNIDYMYAGNKLYVPKINQRGELDDWRYLQALIVSYQPKWINGISFGFIRWVQMYSALVEGKYPWLEGNPTYFPVFKNLFRERDRFENYEQQTNQAAGLFFKWIWKDSNAEFYFEFHHNDSKNNLRDLILDSDHSRAATFGLQKIFNINNNKYLFNWSGLKWNKLLRD